MHLARLLFLLLSGILVAACTPNEAHYKAMRSDLNSGHVNKGHAIEACASRRMNAEQRKTIAAFMGVAEKRAEITFCRRIANGIASGKITYEDVRILFDEKKGTDNIIRVLRGG